MSAQHVFAELVTGTPSPTHLTLTRCQMKLKIRVSGVSEGHSLLVGPFVPSPDPHLLGVYLLVATATSPPCPSGDLAAPSAARSGWSPRDPRPQLCDDWSLQRCLPHFQLLPPLLTHPAGPKTPSHSPLTSEGTRVQTCSSEAGEGAERQDCGGGAGTLGEAVLTGDMWGQELAAKGHWEGRSLGRMEGCLIYVC